MKNKTNAAAHDNRRFKAMAVMLLPVKTGKAASNGFDDFLMKNPIAVRNEYGERVISGRRIC
jgi:hypothetical protein